MKKNYIEPNVKVVTVELQQMIAASIQTTVDDTPTSDPNDVAGKMDDFLDWGWED